MSTHAAVLSAAMLSTLLPVGAVALRGRANRMMLFTTGLTAAALSIFLGILFHMVSADSAGTAQRWAHAMVASAVPVLLAGYLLSSCLGRDCGAQSMRESRWTFILLGLWGLGFISMVRHHAFVAGYVDHPGERGTIHFGPLGKAYLSYLMIGIVVVGYNLEKTYRSAPVDSRYRIRLPLLGFFSLLGFFAFTLATGMLYGAIGLGRLVGTAVPIAFASVVIAHGYLRGTLVDGVAPVSRNIVYSSFTALAAALFVLAFGVAAQIAAWTKWTPDEILTLAFGFLVVLAAILFLVSNRFKRRVRRYIDRNFYVNRHDYRSQWSRMTEALANATDRDSVLDRAVPFLLEAFAADEITIALRDEASHVLRPVRGKGSGSDSESLEASTPLVEQLSQDGKTLLLDRKPHDFTYIPIYAEDGGWLDATASQMVAPLLEGNRVVGIVGLERHDRQDPFTFEDAALLDTIAAHIASALRSVALARELAESREIELMSQWSSMLLHDLKNYLSPLRMAALNLTERKDTPGVAAVCAQDISRVTDRMEELVHTLSQLRANPQLGMDSLCPNQVVRETLAEMQVSRRPEVNLDLRLEAVQKINADGAMLRRVLENLVINAVEAMDGAGKLSVRTLDQRVNGSSAVVIEVADTGKGISEEFMRDRLFRPFSTTKRKGLGLGLYQCRSIVHAHGGELSVKSAPGEGAAFRIVLQAAEARHEGGGRAQSLTGASGVAS